MSRRASVGIALRFAAGGLVSAFFIWLSLRDKDLGAMWQAFERAHYGYLVPYVVILLTIHVLRTVRWGILLEPVAKVPFWRLNRAAAVGFMALMVLPFRLGELVRPYLVSERGPAGTRCDGIRMSAATASVVMERVADGITTAAMLLATMILTVPDDGSPHLSRVRIWAWVFLGVFACALAVLLMFFWQRERAVAVIRGVLRPLSPHLADRVSALLESFLSGLRLAPHRGKLALFVLTTVAYWGINGVGMLLVAKAFGLHLGLLQMYTVLGMLVIGVMIPAGPGMVGTFQFFALLGLSLFVSRTEIASAGAAWANLLWAAQFGQQVLLGLVFLLAGNLSFKRLVVAGEESLEAPRAAGGGGAPRRRPRTACPGCSSSGR